MNNYKIEKYIFKINNNNNSNIQKNIYEKKLMYYLGLKTFGGMIQNDVKSSTHSQRTNEQFVNFSTKLGEIIENPNVSIYDLFQIAVCRFSKDFIDKYDLRFPGGGFYRFGRKTIGDIMRRALIKLNNSITSIDTPTELYKNLGVFYTRDSPISINDEKIEERERDHTGKFIGKAATMSSIGPAGIILQRVLDKYSNLGFNINLYCYIKVDGQSAHVTVDENGQKIIYPAGGKGNIFLELKKKIENLVSKKKNIEINIDKANTNIVNIEKNPNMPDDKKKSTIEELIKRKVNSEVQLRDVEDHIQWCKDLMVQLNKLPLGTAEIFYPGSNIEDAYTKYLTEKLGKYCISHNDNLLLLNDKIDIKLEDMFRQENEPKVLSKFTDYLVNVVKLNHSPDIPIAEGVVFHIKLTKEGHETVDMRVKTKFASFVNRSTDDYDKFILE
jgi:hypothetical protein